MAVARACVYHSLAFDVRHLAASLLSGSHCSPGDDHVVDKFETAFARLIGTRHCVAFPFARSAFHHALRAMNLEPGAEVIMPPITIPPMVDAVLQLGLLPVFVDLDPDSLIFDVEQFRAAMTARTRVAMVTYLFGMAADPSAIVDLCDQAGIALVEDFSHNLGSTLRDRPHGTFGLVGLYSCSATKTLDAYGGGLAVTSDDELAAALRRAQSHLVPPPWHRLPTKVARDLAWNLASRRPVWTAVTFPLLRMLRRWHPGLEQSLSGARPSARVGQELGAPSFERFTPLQARAGLRLLDRLTDDDTRRVGNAERVRAACRRGGLRAPKDTTDGRHVHWQSIAFVDDVPSFQSGLAGIGVDTAPTNLPLVSEMGGGASVRELPVARLVKHNAVYLPVHPRVGRRDLERLVSFLTSTDAQSPAALGRSRP